MAVPDDPIAIIRIRTADDALAHAIWEWNDGLDEHPRGTVVDQPLAKGGTPDHITIINVYFSSKAILALGLVPLAKILHPFFDKKKRRKNSISAEVSAEFRADVASIFLSAQGKIRIRKKKTNRAEQAANIHQKQMSSSRSGVVLNFIDMRMTATPVRAIVQAR